MRMRQMNSKKKKNFYDYDEIFTLNTHEMYRLLRTLTIISKLRSE